MSSDKVVISAKSLSKFYQIYAKPHQRLLQMIFRGRRQYFREFHALTDLNFEIQRGETVGIIGRNGAGKSTLLQLLCGTLQPTTGSVEITGRVAALLELGAGFNPEFTGRENVFLNASILGLTQLQIEERYESIVAFADIGDFIDQPVKTYSSGMYVRLAFSVVAHVDADILIIDEALAVGDALFTQKCMRFLRKFCENGTLLFVSHDSAAVTNLCERAIWLESGQMKEIGPAKEVCKRYNADVYSKSNSQQTKAPVLTSKPEKLKSSIQAIEHIPKVVKDQRFDTYAQFPFVNYLTIQSFNPEDSFGTMEMEVTDVRLMLDSGEPTTFISGGEVVTLAIDFVSNKEVDSVIVGFQFKDKRGQILFGDNTCVTTADKPIQAHPNEQLTGLFKFQMPLLPAGEYSVTVSVAEGNQHEHMQHHWVHDALIVQSQCASVSTGIVGVPMLEISITQTE